MTTKEALKKFKEAVDQLLPHMSLSDGVFLHVSDDVLCRPNVITARVVVTDRTEHRDHVYDAIDGERQYQDNRWPQSNLSVGESILLLELYVAKARASWAQEMKPDAHTLDIIRKIAGIAVHAMERRGVVFREGYEPLVLRKAD